MRLVTFAIAEAEHLGALIGDRVLDLAFAGRRAGVSVPTTMQAFIEAGPRAWDTARGLLGKDIEEAVVAEARLLSPLPRPVRLRDASLFLKHMEIALAKLGKPMSAEFWNQVIYYNADHLHVYGPDQDVPWPRRSSWVDYELEWACVIGLGGGDIARSDAKNHIFGYTVFNDWSARDLQFPFMDAGLGPGGGKDFANSLGPYIVTPDEIANPYALAMTARVDGEVWSSGNTASMHHTFEDAVVGLSADRPLVPGEMIGSGTVVGGCGFELDRRLAPNAVVELEVEQIGVLRNRLAAR